MTVVYYLAILLLLIALTTITLATQPVQGDANEGQSNPGGCISDWRGLKMAYLDRQSNADVENSIFDFYASDATYFGVLVMSYDVGPPSNTSTSGTRECCQRGNKDCLIHFIFRFNVFRYIHPKLLYSRLFHGYNAHSHSSFGTQQLCWAPPSLCNNSLAGRGLNELSQQFIGLVLEESPFHVDLSVYVGGDGATYHFPSLLAITAIPILLFTTAGLFLVLYMHHSWGMVGTVLAHSQVARHTMRSIMLISWILFPWLKVQFYTTTELMADTFQEKAPFTLLQDVYAPQVMAGYAQWGSFLAILLLEAAFLCVFFLRKFTNLHSRKQQLSKTDCHLCYWIRVLCDTLGGIGVVAAVQITSVYLFHYTLFLTVSPITVIAWISNDVSYIVIFLVCTTMLLQMVSSCCKTCSFGSVIKGLAFLLLALLCIAINYYLVNQLERNEQYNYNSLSGMLTSLVSSVIIGIYGCIVKKLLLQKKKDAEETERNILESEPLVKNEG